MMIAVVAKLLLGLWRFTGKQISVFTSGNNSSAVFIGSVTRFGPYRYETARLLANELSLTNKHVDPQSNSLLLVTPIFLQPQW